MQVTTTGTSRATLTVRSVAVMTSIVAKDLHKRYRRRGRRRDRAAGTVAAAGVDLVVGPGEVMGVLGRNGAGKTTCVEIVAGLRRPDRGDVRVLGLDPFTDRRRVRQVLGVQLQDATMNEGLTVRETVRLYRTFYRSGWDPDDLLAAVGLDQQAGMRLDKLSGGQSQRLSIATALVGRPRAVILDELTTGLDPDARRSMWRLVETMRSDGVAVLLVSHHMDEVERLCDHVVVLDEGHVVARGTPADLIERYGGPGPSDDPLGPGRTPTLEDAYLALASKENR